MGLLDSLFAPSTYGGQGGGLLGMLQQYGQMPDASVGQYNPRTLTPDSTMAVGNYQMPVFGQGNPAQLPANSAPAQNQGLPPQVPAQPTGDNAPLASNPAFLQPPTSSGFGGAMRGMMANAQGGPISAILGGIAGGMGMGQGNPQDVARQNLKAQYDSLVPVLGPQKAMLAVMNPEAGKTLLTEAMTNREKFQKIGTDAMGRDQYGFVNELDQTVNGKPSGQAQTGGGIGLDESKPIYGQLPQSQQAIVDNMLAGRQQMPTSFALSKPYWQTLVAAANERAQETGQTFDDTQWRARNAMRTDLAKSTPGSAGGQQTFMNTSLSHLAEVAQKAKELGNWDLGISPLTALVNNARGLTTDQASKIAALQDAAQHYGQEVTKFYAGSPGGEAERSRFLSALSGAKSPKELAAVIESELNLIPGRGDELQTRIRNTLGDAYLQQNPVLSDKSQQAIKDTRAIIDGLRGQAAPTQYTEGMTATNPQTGQKLTFRNGKWQ